MKQYIKNGVVKKRNQIVIHKNGMYTYNPPERMILEDGWEVYTPPTVEPTKSAAQIMQEIVMEQYNARTDIPDAEALDRSVVIFDWEHYIGKTLNEGQCVVYAEEVYRVRQTHQVQEHYAPSLATASLYEVIVLTASGEESDPIPYTPPMEVFAGKYYSEEGVKYLCTRSSETALTHHLAALVGIYVEQVNA